MPVFDEATATARRQRAEQALGANAPILVVGAGEPIGVPGGLDRTYPFLAHPEYYWLTGARRAGGVVVFEPGAGWTHFVRPASAEERLWEGEPDVPEGEDLAKFEAWAKARAGRKIAALGVPPKEVAADPASTAAAQVALDAARRPKDDAEIALLRRAAAATAAGYARLPEWIRPGVTERRIQVELEAEFYRAGCDGVGYGTIVGAGTHAAVLHFEPGDRVVGEDDVVLIDAGGHVAQYTSDVTRTFHAKGRLNPQQKAIYDVVLAAEVEGIGLCTIGREWHDVHRACARVLAQGLKDLGLLRGEVDGLLESEAITCFFPHGIGHMVGLYVRDVGGRAPGREEGRKCCGTKVRVDLPLGEHFVMTVEPGIYFVPAILDDPERRKRFPDAVAWDAAERWRPVGGVRIEDNILVTRSGPENLTAAIPK
ncbi:MAG TPA: aminopeptidase P N-terminal domain-containing protein [Candidatus Polarisedimenticolaceae bacterium]